MPSLLCHDVFEKSRPYICEIVDEAGVDALGPMNALQKVGGYRKDVPLNAYYGAALTAARYADCGPCLQLGVSTAQAAGVNPEVIRAILSDDPSMNADAKLGAELATATVRRDLKGERARAEILRRWGRRALVSLAYGIVATQSFPAFKYAIGHGNACVRVRVGGEDLRLREAAAS